MMDKYQLREQASNQQRDNHGRFTANTTREVIKETVTMLGALALVAGLMIFSFKAGQWYESGMNHIPEPIVSPLP